MMEYGRGRLRAKNRDHGRDSKIGKMLLGQMLSGPKGRAPLPAVCKREK